MRYTSEELKELEDPESWDFDTVQVLPPVKNPMAIVKVTFNRDELNHVETMARQRGMSLIAFIKESALRCSAPSESESHNHTDPVENGVRRNDADSHQSHPGIKD